MGQWIGWALIQIMACGLFSAKPLSKPMLLFCQFDHKEQIWNFNQNTKFFIHENASENIVCEMATILSRGAWVNATWCVVFVFALYYVVIRYQWDLTISFEKSFANKIPQYHRSNHEGYWSISHVNPLLFDSMTEIKHWKHKLLDIPCDALYTGHKGHSREKGQGITCFARCVPSPA